jgi:hypothetical protein
LPQQQQQQQQTIPAKKSENKDGAQVARAGGWRGGGIYQRWVEQYKHLPVHKRKIIENTVIVRRQNFKQLPYPSNMSVWFPSSKVLYILFIKIRKNPIIKKIQ